MLSFISPFATIWTFLVLVTIFILQKYFLRPYLSVLRYQKQGGYALFYKELISYFKNSNNITKHGNFFHTYLEIMNKNPDIKFIVENEVARAKIILLDPEMIKEFLRKYEVYHKDGNMFKLFMETAAGTVIFSEDAVWKKKRKIISSAFNFEFLKDVVPMIVETTQSNFNQWIESGNLKDMNLVENLGVITGEVTGRFFFGKTFGDQKLGDLPITIFVQQFLNNVVEELLAPSTILFGTKIIKTNLFQRHKKLNDDSAALRKRCREMIEETERSVKKEKNLLTHLLDLRASGKEEDRLTNEEIVGEFIGIFAAGTDTTSHLVNAAIYFLSQNPEAYRNLREEVDREFADLSKVNIESVNKMEYTTAVLKESLRLAGPANQLFDRIAMTDDDLCGLKVKKGDSVNISPNLFALSEKYYSKHAEFHPERWLTDGPFNEDGFKSQPYAFTPFSAGPKNCVGQHLAMIEARIIISLFVRTFKFSFPEDYKFLLVPRFTYEPLDPLMVTLEPKHQV